MKIETVSVTGEAILAALKRLGLLTHQDAICQFVRVDQNTREVFLDYGTNKNVYIDSLGEGSFRWTTSQLRAFDIFDGVDRLKRQILSSARQPNPRPPGVADNWWYGEVR